jgi:adiponectin receptor
MSFILAYRRPKEKLIRPRAPSAPKLQENLIQQLRTKPYRLLKYEELPKWYQDNHFCRSGYRPVSNSWIACLLSIGHLHNESLNIYTHLIPAVGMLFGQILIHVFLNHFYPDVTLGDHAVFSIQANAAVITLLLSSSYHTMICHSQGVENLMLRVDYVGILTLILGSFFTGIYVGFYCEPILCRIYWAMIITLSSITATLVLHPRLQGLKYRPHRTWAFISTALSGFAPIIHGLLLYGWSEMWVRSGMPYWLLEGLVYGIGAFFFITRLPESIWPGRFDIWFSSHQFFHIFVVMASLVHLYGVWIAYDWNYQHQRVCPARHPLSTDPLQPGVQNTFG